MRALNHRPATRVSSGRNRALTRAVRVL